MGCNLNIDVFERQSNDWYGEGDDMIFIDGDELPTLNGTGTEDYFNTAFGPSQNSARPIMVSQMLAGMGAMISVWREKLYVSPAYQDPIYFQKSIRVTIEHGHSNMLANDYSAPHTGIRANRTGPSV